MQYAVFSLLNQNKGNVTKSNRSQEKQNYFFCVTMKSLTCLQQLAQSLTNARGREVL